MILTFLGLSNKIITNDTIPKIKPQSLSISASQQKKIGTNVPILLKLSYILN